MGEIKKFINYNSFIFKVDIIKLKEVTKEYKKQIVLDNVNLTLEAGDVLGVIGQSGSGKSTLLNLIAGFIRPTEGKVTYTSHVHNEERDLHRNLNKVKKHIGFTPQHNSFYHKLTVMENLNHFGRLQGLNKETLQGNIKSLLEVTKLEGQNKKLADHLSGGMQKRLDISCSLIHKPRILILDEPTADLDPILQEEILHLLEQVSKQGVTIVIASHHLDSIERICNKVAVIHKGKVHKHGVLDDLRKPYLRDHFTIHVHSGPEKESLIEKLRQLPIKKIIDKHNKLIVYPEDVKATINDILQIIKDENLYLHDMKMQKPSLNEIFHRIVKEDGL